MQRRSSLSRRTTNAVSHANTGFQSQDHRHIGRRDHLLGPGLDAEGHGRSPEQPVTTKAQLNHRLHQRASRQERMRQRIRPRRLQKEGRRRQENHGEPDL